VKSKKNIRAIYLAGWLSDLYVMKIKLLTNLVILITFTSFTFAMRDDVVLLEFIKDDHLVTLAVDQETMKESRMSSTLSKEQVKQKAIKALDLWYEKIPATVGSITLDAEQYRYSHPHPKRQKDLEQKYYWGRAMISFEASPLNFYEIDFLALEDGTILPAQRSYHPELRHYDISYTDGKVTSVKQKEVITKQ
jgi:hypothetical protein